jgi:hypothetical protein
VEPVLLESGSRRVFASALSWPGWVRAGKTEELALEELSSYRDRFFGVASRAGLELGDARLEVVERIEGDATTDFGAPSKASVRELSADAADGAARRIALLQAAWELFDKTVASAPEHLRKGPRGGGRDRDAISDHVANAELAYGRKLGIRGLDLQAVREELVIALGRPQGSWEGPANSWSPAYGARRIIWHVLDHAWEIEDKSS